MYKLGVMSAVIMMTLFLAFKGVFIGTLILILNLTFFAVKFGLFLKGHDHHSHGWSPHGHGWPQKDVHLHIHNGHGKQEFIPYSPPSGPAIFEHSAGPDTHWSGYSNHHVGRHFPNEIIVKSLDDIDESSKINSYDYNTNDNNNSNSNVSEFEIAAALIDKKSDKLVESNEVLSPYNYLRQSRDMKT